MNPIQLNAFVAVVEQGSFRAAAEHLFKTQPSVSSAVKALEDKFGLKLFSRDHYRPLLTPEGKAFYKHAKRFLAQMEQLEQTGYALADGLSPKLSICLSTMCGDTLELSTLKRFTEAYPQVELSVSSGHLHGVLHQLEVKGVDLAIGPRYGLTDAHECIEISKVKMVTVISPSLLSPSLLSPAILDGEKISLTQKEIARFPHILTENTGPSAFDHLNVLPFGPRWYINDYQIKKTLMIAGLGWARIPEQMIKHELETGTLKQIEVEQFNSSNWLPIYLIRLRHQPMSEQANNFWTMITKATQNNV